MYEGMEEHRFYGIHAQRADELKNLGFFDRLIDVLAVAPIVGFEYGRRSDKDNTEGIQPKAMFLAQLQKVDSQLEMNYKTIMLLDNDYQPDEAMRFRKAFQVAPDKRDEADLERYESYVRGGIDFLYEKLVGSENTPYERLIELHDLVESFSDRYSSDSYEYKTVSI